MRHLLLISLIWAVALTVPKFILSWRQMDMAVKQQQLIEKQLEIKRVEQELLLKLLPQGKSQTQSYKGLVL